MKYHIHENGWTVIVEDFDFRQVTPDEIKEICRLIATNTCVVFKDQHLTVEEENRVCRMFKNPRPQENPNDPDQHHYWVPGTDGIITRVTGEKNEYGVPGIAAYEDEFVWHCNYPAMVDRRSIVWLYGVRGTAGSRTSWTNNILSYNDLDNDTKERMSKLKFSSLIAARDMTADSLDLDLGKVGTITRPVVHTNIAGKVGLFFPFNQIFEFEGMSPEESKAIIEPMSKYITQDKYCYHHDWKDGDVVISEQWLGVHKRWPFKNIEKRLLHRCEMDFVDQDYTS